MSTVTRLIPQIDPVNPKAAKSIQQAQAALDRGLNDAVRELYASRSLNLTQTQAEHAARLAILIVLNALEGEDMPAGRLCPAFVDRLNREHWISRGV